MGRLVFARRARGIFWLLEKITSSPGRDHRRPGQGWRLFLPALGL